MKKERSLSFWEKAIATIITVIQEIYVLGWYAVERTATHDERVDYVPFDAEWMDLGAWLETN